MSTTCYTLIRLPRLLEMTGLGRSSLYLRLNPSSKYFDPDFPKPVCLSANGKGSVAWVLAEIEAWIERQMAKRQ